VERRQDDNSPCDESILPLIHERFRVTGQTLSKFDVLAYERRCIRQLLATAT